MWGWQIVFKITKHTEGVRKSPFMCEMFYFFTIYEFEQFKGRKSISSLGDLQKTNVSKLRIHPNISICELHSGLHVTLHVVLCPWSHLYPWVPVMCSSTPGVNQPLVVKAGKLRSPTLQA